MLFFTNSLAACVKDLLSGLVLLLSYLFPVLLILHITSYVIFFIFLSQSNLSGALNPGIPQIKTFVMGL